MINQIRIQKDITEYKNRCRGSAEERNKLFGFDGPDGFQDYRMRREERQKQVGKMQMDPVK